MTTRPTQTPEHDPHLSARPVRPTEPRLTPLAPDGLDDNQADAMRLVGDMGNIFATLVRHPGLFRKWVPFGGKLLSGKLPARDRELLILRVGWRCHAEYEWAQHVRIGLAGVRW